MSSLQEKSHRVVDPQLFSMHSNLRVIQLSPAGVSDKANIKDIRCRESLLSAANKYGGVDMLILDAGEYSGSFAENRRFWFDATGSIDNFLHSVLHMMSTLKQGGRMVFKMNGLWTGSFEVTHSIRVNSSL